MNRNNKKQIVVKKTTTHLTKVPKHKSPTRVIQQSVRGRDNSGDPAAARMRSQYIQTLQDPWEYSAIPLGYDTYVPTTFATGYFRSSLTVNATDGSFALSMTPSIVNMVYTGNAGSGTTTMTSHNASNTAAIQMQGQEGRVVSGGIRVVCLFPQTSAPGILFATSDISSSTTAIGVQSPLGIASLSSAELGIGNLGCRSVILPLDPDSYSFLAPPVLGYSAGLQPYSSCCLIAGLGFPIGTVVWYESILNLEILPSTGNTSVGMDVNSPSLPPSLSTYYLSPSNLVNSIRGLVGPSAVMDGALTALDMASSVGVPYAGALARGTRTVRSTFGSGRNLVAGRNEHQRGRQNTILIEEMKENEML